MEQEKIWYSDICTDKNGVNWMGHPIDDIFDPKSNTWIYHCTRCEIPVIGECSCMESGTRCCVVHDLMWNNHILATDWEEMTSVPTGTYSSL
jgi:hypothetical protein